MVQLFSEVPHSNLPSQWGLGLQTAFEKTNIGPMENFLRECHLPTVILSQVSSSELHAVLSTTFVLPSNYQCSRTITPVEWLCALPGTSFYHIPQTTPSKTLWDLPKIRISYYMLDLKNALKNSTVIIDLLQEVNTSMLKNFSSILVALSSYHGVYDTNFTFVQSICWLRMLY